MVDVGAVPRSLFPPQIPCTTCVSLGFPMDINLICWNVRGLGSPARRKAVNKHIEGLCCNFVCLQEIKMNAVTSQIVAEAVGHRFSDNFLFLPADGTRGGILIACTAEFEIVHNPAASLAHFISATISGRSDGRSWTFTGVYGPQDTATKIELLQELYRIKQLVLDKWLVAGDFNMICRASEKSNDNLNLQLMGRFRNTIQQLELREFHLHGRRFTSTNERKQTTLTKIDRVLVSIAWEEAFPNYQLTPSSTDISDHCPLVLNCMYHPRFKGFRFEELWHKLDGLNEVVTAAWQNNIQATDAIRIVHIKLARTVAALKK